MKNIEKYLMRIVALIVAVFVILVLTTDKEVLDTSPKNLIIVVADTVDNSLVTGVEDSWATIVEEGWSKPVKPPFNDNGREDSSYITRDGRYIIFYHDPIEGEFRESTGKKGPIQRMWYSKRPFTKKELFPLPFDGVNVAAGLYISQKGDLYYTKTFIVTKPKPHLKMPQKTVMNDGEKIIDMGTGEAESDPHYCDATDELYVNVILFSGSVGNQKLKDQNIAVMKNGKTSTLGQPINMPDTTDFQPFLTDDGQTMYFTSSRDSLLGNIFPFQIYRSKRIGELEWGEPELFISFPKNKDKQGGIGEFGMTRDGKQIVFTELKITKKDEKYIGQTEIYYAEKK